MIVKVTHLCPGCEKTSVETKDTSATPPGWRGLNFDRCVCFFICPSCVEKVFAAVPCLSKAENKVRSHDFRQ